MMYKLLNKATPNSLECVLRMNDDGSHTVIVCADPSNTDYQAYLKWLDEGNEPEPADEPASE